MKAGAFSIDIVIEGANDRPLAVELDGDAFHGPDVWERDMARQAALERAGWVFWRVFGSQWNAAREDRWQDLLGTLGWRGIGPIGAEALDERFTEFRGIDAFDYAMAGKGADTQDMAVDSGTAPGATTQINGAHTGAAAFSASASQDQTLATRAAHRAG